MRGERVRKVMDDGFACAGSISQYMEKVIQRIESENLRSRKFLYASSYQKVSQ